MSLHDDEIDHVVIESFPDGHIEIRQGDVHSIYLSESQFQQLKQRCME